MWSDTAFVIFYMCHLFFQPSDTLWMLPKYFIAWNISSNSTLTLYINMECWHSFHVCSAVQINCHLLILIYNYCHMPKITLIRAHQVDKTKIEMIKFFSSKFFSYFYLFTFFFCIFSNNKRIDFSYFFNKLTFPVIYNLSTLWITMLHITFKTFIVNTT